MATPRISPVVQQSKPAVIPFPKTTPEVITQRELAELRLLTIKAEEANREFDAKRESIRTMLELGCSVEPGLRTARLEDQFRRSVSWKDVVVRLAERLKLNGEAYCANVLEHTKPTRSVKLIVE